MQGLVYIFIASISVAIAGTAYFGLTFTPIEALLAGLIGLVFSLFLLERTLRQRDQIRLERSVQDLSRLLSTDAQAGRNLSQRMNELADLELGSRVDVLEADVSVLGTVVRELAETLAELERAHAQQDLSDPDGKGRRGGIEYVSSQEEKTAEPVIPPEVLREALADDRLVHHMLPIVTLPQRRTHGYDLVPRLMLEGDELAEPPDFMPGGDAQDLIAQIEGMALMDAITIARRSKTGGEPVAIYIPISSATLSDKQSRNQLMAILDANRAIAELLNFSLTEQQWDELQKKDGPVLKALAKNGAGFSISAISSLRLNFSELGDLGVRSVRADAKLFIDNPSHYTDFHTADIAAYVHRFDVDLIMCNVTTEQQVLTLIDDGIGFAQGPYLATAGPIRSDLLSQNDDFLQVNLAGQ
ncbi:MAG TPA: EAL domain-containing protein [Devosia sp.]|nr:EAL domain-containing protein [Devosia sp.]